MTSTLHSRLLKCGSDGEAAISWESISGRAGPYTTLQTSEANSSGNLKYLILHLNIFKMMAWFWSNFKLVTNITNAPEYKQDKSNMLCVAIVIWSDCISQVNLETTPYPRFLRSTTSMSCRVVTVFILRAVLSNVITPACCMLTVFGGKEVLLWGFIKVLKLLNCWIFYVINVLVIFQVWILFSKWKTTTYCIHNTEINKQS